MKFVCFTFLLVFGFVQSQNKCDHRDIQNVNSDLALKVMPIEMNDSDKFGKLADGVKLTDEVREEGVDDKGEKSFKIISVAEKLKELGAKYENEKLFDSKGIEIRFYKPPVRGASQGFEEDQKQQKLDAEELKKLREEYTVIILYINPLKVM